MARSTRATRATPAARAQKLPQSFWVVLASTPTEDWVARTFVRFENAMRYARWTLRQGFEWTMTIYPVEPVAPVAREARDGR